MTLLPTEESRAYRAEALPMAVVYEDDDLLVIDKEAGMVVHPAAGNWSGTLLNGLLARDPQSAALPRAGIVHRLDKDTSGLMVVGKTLVAVTALVRAIAGREVQRRYLAIAHGKAPAAPFSVEAPIGRDPQMRLRMAVVASGKPARTDVERIAADDGAAAPCAAPCTPGARTRSACTWRRAACRWSATASTAARRRWASSARRCMPPSWRSPIRCRAGRSPSPRPCRATWRRPGGSSPVRRLEPGRRHRLQSRPFLSMRSPRRAAILPPPERSTRPSRPDRTRVCISTTGQRSRTGPAAFQT